MNWTFDKLGLNSPHYGHDSMMHSHWNRPCHCCKLKLILNTKIVISQKHDIANEFLRISNIRMPRIFFPINICEGCRTTHQSKEVQIGPIWRRNFVPGKRQRHSGILTQVSAQDHLQLYPRRTNYFNFVSEPSRRWNKFSSPVRTRLTSSGELLGSNFSETTSFDDISVFVSLYFCV